MKRLAVVGMGTALRELLGFFRGESTRAAAQKTSKATVSAPQRSRRSEFRSFSKRMADDGSGRKGQDPSLGLEKGRGYFGHWEPAAPDLAKHTSVERSESSSAAFYPKFPEGSGTVDSETYGSRLNAFESWINTVEKLLGLKKE